MKIICSNCANNFEVIENQTTAVCPSCGYSYHLPCSYLSKTDSKRKRSGIFWFVCGILSVLLLFSAFFYIFIYKNEPEETATAKKEKEKSAALQEKIYESFAARKPKWPSRSKFSTVVIDGEKYPEATAPDQPLLIHWNFASKDIFAYDLSVKMESTVYMTNAPMKQDLTLKGNVLIKSQGNKTANLVLDNLVMNQKFDGQEPMELKYPSKVVQGMKEDGNFDIDDRLKNPEFGVLATLPDKPLNVGQSTDVFTSTVFNALGATLKVKIKHKLTLTGYVTINKHPCARFEAEISALKLDVPEDIKGEYEFKMSGKGVLYFDIVDHAVFSYVSYSISGFSAESKIPRNNDDSLPEKVSMTMWNDTLSSMIRNRKKENEED